MSVVEIIFSPTGGTWKAANMIDRNGARTGQKLI